MRCIFLLYYTTLPLILFTLCFGYGYYPKQNDALKDAYYAQVELIRRGLPKIVVQAEYAYATNYICMRDSYFRERQDMSSFQVYPAVWYKMYHSNYFARYAIKYIDYLKTWKPNINFLTFTKYPELPDMTADEQAMVDAHWQTTYSEMANPPRIFFSYSAFSFPRNIDILYDPNRNIACSEYQKFGPVDVPEAMNARLFLIITLVSAIEISYMGGDKNALTQLFRHIVSYFFNGVRCTRKEGAGIYIPLNLQNYYTRYLAYLYADIVNPNSVAAITKEAVEQVYEGEISSLTSYNSWGNVEYATLQTSNSVPKIYNSISTILTSTSKYGELTSASARQLVRQGIVSNSSLRTSSGYSFVYRNSTGTLSNLANLVNSSTHSVSCYGHFFYMPREKPVQNLLEHCCAMPCDIWGFVSGYQAGSPFDECCTRCNQFYCPPDTPGDEDNVVKTEILIPEFGEQESYSVRLVML